ncbi:MAG: class I SAM-dependent methyltransferase [Bacteroidales bacterium]|nr:class I SAM-dependent methyltransferase [Bacteroidales bacterium]
MCYEDYFISKYLNGKENLKMLSIGCGNGSHERKFALYPQFSLIEGIDFASGKIEEARKLAAEQNLNNIKYHAGDFFQQQFGTDSYDIILFNSSLHHFDDMDNFLKTKIAPLLTREGYLIIFEYVGPNRLQWQPQQLAFARELLIKLPVKFRMRAGSNALKNNIYRPGLLRMLLVDPSEAIDAEMILPAIHKHFETLEEKQVGGNILHILLKDIAHNFIDDNPETLKILHYLFEKEDELSPKMEVAISFSVYTKNYSEV